MAKLKLKPEPSEAVVLAVAGNTATGAVGSRPLPLLRELGQARAILDDWLAETEGEETPEIADLFAKLEGEVKEKVERWGLYLLDREATAATMKADEDFYRAEADRLKARRVSFEHATDRSGTQLQFQMEVQGVDKVEGLYCTVQLQLNPPKCIGDVDAETLAGWFADETQPTLQSFVRYVPETFALDRDAVKLAAKLALVEQLPAGLQIVREKRLVVK